MRNNHDMETARRNAENTISTANKALESHVGRNPRERQRLTAMIKDATQTLRDIDDMRGNYGDYNDDINAAVNAIGRILPHITDDDYGDNNYGRGGYEPANRRGRQRVRGYTRRRPRADYNDNDNYNDYSDDERIEMVTHSAARAAAETSRQMTGNNRNNRSDYSGNNRSDYNRNNRANDNYDENDDNGGIGVGRR